MLSIALLEVFLAIIGFIIFCFLGSSNNDGLPRNWPFVGMLPFTLLNLHRPYEIITEVVQRSRGNFCYEGLWFCNMEVLNTADPRNIHYIMSSNFSNFPKGPTFSKIFDILGRGIFNSDSYLWEKQRTLAHSLINHHRFQQFLVKTSRDKVETRLVPVLEHMAKQRKVLDLQDLFQRYTFDVTCLLVTGYDPGCLSIELPHVPFSKALEEAEEAIFYRHIWPELFLKLQRLLGVGQEEKLRKAKETLDQILAEYISRKREEVSREKVLRDEEDGVDLLTTYMRDSEFMGSDIFLRDTIINFMIAGRDTTSSALAWFFWLLSQHPEVADKIREELKSAIPPQEKPERWRLFSIEEVKNLVYLHGALCETLRLYPPVPFQHKSPLQRDILPTGHHVHPKMMIVFCLYSMGRLKSLWGEDCLEFKPERWITERGKMKHEPSYKFLAFNAGPRTCLGKAIAFTQMKVVAAAILHNYHVKVVEDQIVSPATSIILHMKHGLKVTVSPRWT